MHSQTLSLEEKDRARFEKLATEAGQRNFSKRGKMYCVTDLNIMAQGFALAMKSLRAQLGEV